MVAEEHYGQLTPCPRCGYSDSVLGVPAAYAAARSTEAAARVVRDDEASHARRHAARAVVRSALPIVPANELALAPTSFFPEFGWGVVFFGVVAVGALAIYQLAADHSGDFTLLVVSAVAGLLFMLCISQLPRALARHQKIKAGKSSAEAIWRLGWYCCRCAIVYFQAGEDPVGSTPGQPLTPAQFKRIVWTAGRYG